VRKAGSAMKARVAGWPLLYGSQVESGCTTCGYYSSICTVLVPDILLISLLVQREVSSVLVSSQACGGYSI